LSGKIMDIATKGTLQRPITFKVDGETYNVVRLNRSTWESAQGLEAEIRAGNFGALYDQVVMMTNVPKELVDAMDIMDLRDLVEHISDRIRGKGEPEAAKNGLETGETPAL